MLGRCKDCRYFTRLYGDWYCEKSGYPVDLEFYCCFFEEAE